MQCYQSLYHKDHSVLSLAATQEYIFCGTQGSCIHAWGAQDFLPKKVLTGHTGSVFSLVLDVGHHTLYSASGDGTVRAWDTTTLTCRFVLHSGPNVGDILSLAYCPQFDTLFMGCQNTSIQWFSPSSPDSRPKSPKELEHISQNSKFFDSATSQTFALELDPSVEHYVVFDNNIQPHSHYGHVYSLLLGSLPNQGADPVLFSGSGDGEVKLWSVSASGISPLRSLKGDITNIFAMTLSEGLLFCGCQDGLIKIWDLETNQMMLRLKAHSDDVLTLVSAYPNLYSASADGSIKIWDRNFQCLWETDGPEGIVLTSILSGPYLVTGSSDQVVKFWHLPEHALGVPPSPHSSLTRPALLTTLEKWITYSSISGSPRYQHDCRRAARFLKTTCEQLGAESRLIPGGYGQNPLVFARFRANAPPDLTNLSLHPGRAPSATDSPSPGSKNAETPTVLVYGHYDVFSVDESLWDSPPFEMHGRDGFLYGRGVTDDKGPILAMLYAVFELHQAQELAHNVEFLIEGEEENGSVGLKEAVQGAGGLFGRPSVILLSNSYWIGEDLPCLTYGLRGAIHSTIQVICDRKDVHSGVSGGAVVEPLQIVLKLVSQLVDDQGRVSIPEFYDSVAPPQRVEDTYYRQIVQRIENRPLDEAELEKLKARLMARWRFPSLTVHKVDVSGPQSNDSIIPHSAQASVSLRVVPNQAIDTVAAQFTEHVQRLFDQLFPGLSPASASGCRLNVTIRNTADWWLGDTTNAYFQAAEQAITNQWGTKPMYIREGGTIGAVPWLEHHFESSAVNIPLGQSSDQAHLSNERIRLKNLLKGKEVMKDFFRGIGQPQAQTSVSENSAIVSPMVAATNTNEATESNSAKPDSDAGLEV
ncbi:hypothetical protein BJ085DRAFT_21959 [Dimargaris cristalligena]|uniref:Peptidase M20 dimerisation domain-containing protein n=1 Tax=Dimargaris cristalligena TaxID=215637 RepID=A0A4P9ZMX8_9FUNG|nr:hypothetical protein BJ085DRAFT_21959 [Dimargaris cristalligena]|eukprot:RKP34448.1 hypothetical protein BJ085DRAFT_21959 [Dimargaris cristalligena]